MQSKFEPTEKMLELKRQLLLLPKNRRKAVLENGIKRAKLKAEREELLKEREELLKEQGATSS